MVEPTMQEFDSVVLARAVEAVGRVIPAGTRGTIVHVYAGGEAFEVEFGQPHPCVVTVERADIREIAEGPA